MIITKRYIKIMAQYNKWQNQSLYDAASTLSDEERKLDRGAFFSSIHSTLSHILWADQIWMHRLAGFPAPPPVSSIVESTTAFPDWETLKQDRQEMDDKLIEWAEEVEESLLEGELAWTSSRGSMRKPYGFVVMHFFNHQTHHRGQVHGMLTQAGSFPASDTDLLIMPNQLET